MSFYTSLTGLQAATTELSVTSNNIANAGTSGFKRADADFGDIFASTPLQKAGSIAGSGVALNQITQQHTQGNIEFSSNSLDLAITGDGYFKLKTSDGAELYTRNGGFMLDEQNQLVNKAGQALQILPVDSINNANFEAETTGLTVQRSTVGEFVPTTEINLGLNLPSSAEPITAAFNKDKPETYHKTTSFTTFGANGNAQLATIYYVKTANPTDDSPYSKWQTYVTIDGADVRSALTQSAGAGNDPQFINKYGEIKTKKELDAYAKLTTDPVTGAAINQAEYLITAGTTYRKYSLDNLQTAIPSANASVTTEIAATSPYKNGLNLTAGSAGVNFADNGGGANQFTNGKLSNMFEVKVDGSIWRSISLPRLMTMSHLTTTAGAAAGSQTLSGKQIATELTNELNKAFGDDKQFDLSNAVYGNLILKRYANSEANVAAGNFIAVDLEAIIETAVDGAVMHDGTGAANGRKMSGWQIAHAITNHVRGLGGTNWDDVTVEYDEKNQGFKFHQTKATPDVITVGATTAALRSLLGNVATNTNNNTKDGTTLTNQTVSGSQQLLEDVRGNGEALVASSRRSGLLVEYAGGKFTFKSGKTGDASSIEVRATETNASKGNADNVNVAAYTVGGLMSKTLLGLAADTAKTRTENNKNQITAAVESLVENLPTVRGQESTAAKLIGNAMGVDTEQAFNVSAANQNITAVIDGVTNTVKLTLGQYNIDTFVAELQTKLNLMADANGKTVSNVVVGFDTAKTALTVTGATASSKSFIQLLGSQDWGLTDVPVAFGSTSTYAKIDTDQLAGSNLYVSQDPATGLWNESVDKADFDAGNIPYWTPIFLDRGEITFDTSGALVSPQAKYNLESNNATGTTIQLAYTGSTQYNSAFAAISQSQNGKPEGDINGISIGDDGLIVASYSNGTQKSLGKVVIANFNSNSGLTQIGDAAWTASGKSGEARLGEAGSAGYGTIRAGSRERSNVDLTNELVDLIAAQRNFQANAKAIETNTAMTSAIINIRG
ncbi:MAG: flagellar hook-basal body complex protein [Pseudohongiellaceae bacterium]